MAEEPLRLAVSRQSLTTGPGMAAAPPHIAGPEEPVLCPRSIFTGKKLEKTEPRGG